MFRQTIKNSRYKIIYNENEDALYFHIQGPTIGETQSNYLQLLYALRFAPSEAVETEENPDSIIIFSQNIFDIKLQREESRIAVIATVKYNLNAETVSSLAELASLTEGSSIRLGTLPSQNNFSEMVYQDYIDSTSSYIEFKEILFNQWDGDTMIVRLKYGYGTSTEDTEEYQNINSHSSLFSTTEENWLSAKNKMFSLVYSAVLSKALSGQKYD